MPSIHPTLGERRHDTRSGSRDRGRLLIAATLLVLTAITAFATRLALARPDRPPSETPPLVSSASGPVRFTAQLDRSSILRNGDGLVHVELAIGGGTLPSSDTVRVPTDLVVVLDRSGSMNGAPLSHAKAAVRTLVAQLAGEDRFALVAYASGAELAIPLGAAAPDARATWYAALAGVRASGGTNMAAGLDLAARTATELRESGRAVRVILISDGHANEGDHSREGLVARAARAVGGEYVLSAVGVGSSFDEGLMTALADAGTGNFHYLHHARALDDVFAGEFASARETVASGLEVEIRTAEGVEVVDAAGYPLEREPGLVRFRPGSLFAGQERRVFVTLRAPARAVGDVALGRLALRYAAHGERTVLVLPASLRVACVEGEEDFYASVDRAAWARSVVVDEVNALKQQVSAALQAGDRARAETRIEGFLAAKREENAVLESEDVDRELRSLGSVLDAVRAPMSPSERNALSKELSAAAFDGRRVGAKR
jgi:Ca-activated chloride channel family protein